MQRACRSIVLLLFVLAASVRAQTFVLDPYFGSNGIATFEWPASNGYQWDAVNAWATRLDNGKWAVATQLRDGTQQIAAVNWFDADGGVSAAQPGAGAYTPFQRFGWNLAGIVQDVDGSLSLGTSVSLSANDIDFQFYRTYAEGGAGYNGCNGSFFQNLFFDLGSPTAMADVMGALTEDSARRQVAVGTLAAPGGETRIGVARIPPLCGLDASFNGNGKQVIDPNPYLIFPPPRRARANAVVHDALGRILVGGGVTFGLGATDNGACIVVRLLDNGQRDGSFGNGGVAYIDNFTLSPGNLRCDVRGLAVQGDGRILVNMDWTLVNAQGTSRREYNQRLTPQGTYDPSWIDPCCTAGFANAEVRAGGISVLAADGVALLVSSSLVNQAGVDDARGELIPLRLVDGAFAAGFIPNGELPLGFASTSYHRVVIESPDRFLVVATSGTDLFSHRRVHLLRYRRASTIPADVIFRNGFEP